MCKQEPCQNVYVDLGSRSYEIKIGSRYLHHLGQACKDLGLGKQCLLVTDANVESVHAQAARYALESNRFNVATAVVPAGEKSKSHACLLTVYDAALRAGLDRSSFLVALGGGVVGDLAGYAAATFLRGIDLVHVPTSLVSMVDSSVGGKTGVNLPQGKNLIGAFYQPKLVWIDIDLLATLPKREFRSGLAEVVKYGVIKDPELFELLEKRRSDILDMDRSILASIVAKSCAIKAHVVQSDEQEQGERAILNFGHTVGHALEKVAGYGTLLHGEAIAVGMMFAARCSVLLKDFSAFDCERLGSLLASMELPTKAEAYTWEALRLAISVDKKNVGNEPRFVLANKLGSVETDCSISEEILLKVWNDCCK